MDSAQKKTLTREKSSLGTGEARRSGHNNAQREVQYNKLPPSTWCNVWKNSSNTKAYWIVNVFNYQENVETLASLTNSNGSNMQKKSGLFMFACLEEVKQEWNIMMNGWALLTNEPGRYMGNNSKPTHTTIFPPSSRPSLPPSFLPFLNSCVSLCCVDFFCVCWQDQH